jgi:hypothetical protein
MRLTRTAVDRALPRPRSTQTTSRYAHLVDDAARAAVERVSDDLGV